MLKRGSKVRLKGDVEAVFLEFHQGSAMVQTGNSIRRADIGEIIVEEEKATENQPRGGGGQRGSKKSS